MLEVLPKMNADARIAGFVEQFERRVRATPPGTCPLAVQLSLVQACAAQTCGKCVPCRDGIPQMEKLLRDIVDCEADAATVEALRLLAQVVSDASDCAIGYETARMVLEGLDVFAAEYESHVVHGRCAGDAGQKVPCEALCPAHVNVPAYIALVAQGDCAGAVNMVRKDNPFPTACALVCEHPCEERCRRTLVDAPLNIRGIKKFAVDQAPVDTVPVPPRLPSTGRRIAVVGGGPSGMTCAYFASLMGHEVTVFEQFSKLGGMMRYGIPAYRFPRERLDEDVRAILAVGGIEVRCGARVGPAELERLTVEYDAVYVAVGAHAGKGLAVDHADAPGVYSAVDLLREVGGGHVPDLCGKKVVVVGGGNVAMDCARTAVRAGADEVSVVYRRRQEDMTALASEVEAAIAEGVEMVTLAAPVAIEVDATGACCALEVQPQMIGAVSRGRPAPVDAAKPRVRLAADVVLVAVGQGVETAMFEGCGMRVARGCVVADASLRVAGFRNVFAGGDCQTGPATVIRAIGAGKVAARNIDEFLGYRHKLDCGVSVPPARPNDRTPKGRVNIAERPARERRRDFDGVEIEMSPEETAQECGRCLRCDHYGCGTLVGGRIQYV